MVLFNTIGNVERTGVQHPYQYQILIYYTWAMNLNYYTETKKDSIILEAELYSW